jgi:DNA-binding transcriptional MerR regulator
MLSAEKKNIWTYLSICIESGHGKTQIRRRRYRVVEPVRTEGGTRRYSAADLERLRAVKAAVDAGHRISQVAQLGAAELKQIAVATESPPASRLDDLLAPLESLNGAEFHRLVSLQLSVLGAPRFARDIAIPLVQEIGQRWADGEMGIAQEHLATSVLRSLLGSSLQPGPNALLGPLIVFATPSGERHELGLLMAALTAVGAGANPLYLGTELPVEDLLAAVEESGAAVLALSLVTIPQAQATRTVNAIRGGLPSDVHLWLGGSGASDLDLPDGVEVIQSLEALEQRVLLVVSARASG